MTTLTLRTSQIYKWCWGEIGHWTGSPQNTHHVLYSHSNFITSPNVTMQCNDEWQDCKSASVSSRPYAFYYSSTVMYVTPIKRYTLPTHEPYISGMHHVRKRAVSTQYLFSSMLAWSSFPRVPKKASLLGQASGSCTQLIRVLTPCVHGEQHDQTALLLSIKAPRSRVRTPPPLTNSPSASSILHVHAVEAHLTYPHRDEGM